MDYAIRVERRALKQLDRIPEPHNERIKKAIRHLAHNTRPSGGTKLSGRSAWRIRIGGYRVIYEIDDEQELILVVVVGPRGDVYRQ